MPQAEVLPTNEVKRQVSRLQGTVPIAQILKTPYWPHEESTTPSQRPLFYTFRFSKCDFFPLHLILILLSTRRLRAAILNASSPIKLLAILCRSPENTLSYILGTPRIPASDMFVTGDVEKGYQQRIEPIKFFIPPVFHSPRVSYLQPFLMLTGQI